MWSPPGRSPLPIPLCSSCGMLTPQYYCFCSAGKIGTLSLHIEHAQIIDTILAEFGYFSGHQVVNSLGKYLGVPVVHKRTSLGNGNHVSLWHDVWVPTLGPLYNHVSNPLSIDSFTHILDLTDGNGARDLDLHSSVFQPAVIPHIISIKCPIHSDIDDICYWRWTPQHNFEVKSAYEALVGHQWRDLDHLWNMFWHLPIPQRIRVFIWVASQQKIMTNLKRFRRSLASDPSCNLCGSSQELLGMAHKYTSKEGKRWSGVSEHQLSLQRKSCCGVMNYVGWGCGGCAPARLYGLKMQDDHDLAQHVNVFNQIVSDLARLDVKIEDKDRAMILLCSLPPSYEHMNVGESSQADSLYVKGNRDRGQKPEKVGSGKRNSRSKSRDKKTIHCYKCKEAGHMKRNCPKLKKQTDEKRDGSSKSVNVVEDDNSDCSEGDMLSISMTQLTDAWILDSGCSYHITPNREWFSTYKPVNSGSVYLGDDRCCNIVGIGDVRIKMHDGSVRTLSGVRHIPDLKKNLISLGTLHKNGFIPKADEDRETIRIVKGALTVMKGKMTAGNIYRLLGSTVAGGVHSVESCDDTAKLWHIRLAHLSERGMAELHKRNLLHGVKSCKLDFCKYCVLGKQTKVRFKTAKHTTQGILDYVHSDVWGPCTTSSLGGSRYYVTFIDDFSRKVWVYFLKQKYEVFEKFKLWKAEVENQTGRKIKCLRSDNGTEYTDSQFLQFCKEHGIQRHFTVRKTPQQNGVAERMNRSPRASLAGKVAEEVWTGHDVSFDNLRIFGCPAYVHVPADERSKLDAKSKECIFLGYKKGVKGFKFWDPVAKKVVISRDVVFDEQSMLQQKQDTTVVDFEQFPVEKPKTSQPTSGSSTTDDLQDYSLARDRVRRTNIKPPNRLGFEDLVSFALIVSSDDPVTFHDAITSQENDKWMAAMVEEMESLNHNRTWELVPLPEGKKPIGCKWVYKKKPAVTEKEEEKHTSIRAVLALVASWDLHLEQMDVKTAFLHGDLEEQIYMRQPEGFTQPGNEHLVCRLKKSLYGLKQSPRQWYKRFDSYMIKIGYNRCEYDCCVYVKSLDDGSFIFLLLYVDDILIAAKNMDDVIGLKTLLSQEFDMKDLGAAKKILGMEICRDRDSRKLRLSQRGYVEKMLERFAMSSAKPVSTPLANHFKLSSEQCPKTDKEAEDMAKVPYANVIGCLMYAMVCTRPDLAHAVSQVCKYMSKPGKQHWEVVKWIFRYLKGTVGHGIVFGSQRDNPLVVGYVDSDYACTWIIEDLRHAKYMAAAEAAKEALWLIGLVKELGVQQGGVQLLCDNQSDIHLAKNQVYRARIKHIDVSYDRQVQALLGLVECSELLKKQGNPTHIEVSKGQDICQGGDLLGMAHKYTSKEDRRWSGVSEANINCPYNESLVVGLRIMWVGGAGGAPPRCMVEIQLLGTSATSSTNTIIHLSSLWAIHYHQNHQPQICNNQRHCYYGWPKPPHGWIALNVDGAVNNSGQSSIGSLFRDTNGSWICGFSHSIGITSPLQAELWSIYEGMKIEWSLGLEFLQIQTDCSTAIALINSPDGSSSPHALVRAIASLRNQAWVTEMVWIPREANLSADYLSRIAAPQQIELITYDSPPHSVRDLLSKES
ncbi:hypothetical protein F3Y22_tig00111098pilonHSYRG00167 [Hibiscus syriacus]|uniref:Uncharacterized protein n=1 Tax=Hibiscus syriacus TaxID=106335 RepID=A0A6A2Z2X8_HIBSY|nr:hypothetical protein F3Y22_tig00111098pilonHSYRG00167 [Hibiscus syriacus]